jgi:exosortase
MSSMQLVLIGLVGFGPLLAQFFFNLWQYDTYQFFPLALVGAAVLAKRGLDKVPRPLKAGAGLLTMILMLGVLGMLGTAAVMWSPWLGAVSFLLALLAFAWWVGGWVMVKALFPAWLVLLTILPPPLKLDARFALLLQEWATAGSSYLIALMGIPSLLTGLIIEIPGQRMLVEEACSGVNSILFMTSVCVFFAMWKRRGVFFLALLYALTIACVLVGNLVRITFGAWVFFHHRVELFVGWKHEAVGLVLTATYLIFIVTADAILERIFTPHPVSSSEKPAAKNSQPLLAGVYFEGGLKYVTILLAGLCMVQLVRGWNFHFRKEQARVINPEWMDGSAKFSLPPQIAGWDLVSEAKPTPKKAAYEDGVYSHIWQYKREGLLATISLDYPFFNYHDVTVCYRSAGWEISETKLIGAAPDNGMIPYMEVALAKEGGIRADLFYSTVDESGIWLEEPGKRSPYDAGGNPLAEGDLFSRLENRLRQMPYSSEASEQALNYRIQLLAAARGGLGTEQRRHIEKLFREARLALADQFIEKRPTPTPTPVEAEPEI